MHMQVDLDGSKQVGLRDVHKWLKGDEGRLARARKLRLHKPLSAAITWTPGELRMAVTLTLTLT